ncbi:tRNA threonylcarbamoyladenosine dehydratase 1 [Linum perenne]
MEQRVKCFALLGVGVMLGSTSTFLLLKLLSRRSSALMKNRVKNAGVNGDAIAPEDSVKRSSSDRCQSSDLLKDDIVSEQLTRNIQFFGFESQEKVTSSYVVVIGLGGVGSHAASMLLRSGVGRLLLVDFDQVSVSSLNRHAVATREDVGIPKAECLKKHFASIFPEVRIIPVLGTIPAIFGQVMASYVVTQLAGFQVEMEPVVNLDTDHYQILHQRLIEHEESLYGTAIEVEVDVEEVKYIVKELWHGRSARDQSVKDVGRGMWRAINELMLVRWDVEKPASVSNLILLKFKEADEHESRTLDDIKEKEPEFFQRVTTALKRAQLEFGS